MKKIIVVLYLLYLTASCSQKEAICVKEIESNEIVTITCNEKRTNSKDSLNIHLPTEFNVKINSKDVIDLNIYFVIDKRSLMEVLDYEIIDKKNKKSILSFKHHLLSGKPISIIINERNHLISKNVADLLLKKYNINKSLNNLKFGDTIKLVPYNKFRKENKSMINDLRKIEDSIFFRFTSNKGEVFIKEKKINW